MEAGPELDALIIEHVIGRDNVRMVNDGNCQREVSYSTSKSAFWDVVDKMKPLRLSLKEYSDGWYAKFTDKIDDDKWQSVADTAHLAICLAALKAVGHKLEATA